MLIFLISEVCYTLDKTKRLFKEYKPEIYVNYTSTILLFILY